MAYIYLAYCKADIDTAFAMRDVLKKEGFDVWMDENEHELGFWHWWQIQKNIRKAWALVLLVSDAAKQSKRLKRELDYAQGIKKQIFQIVTEGDAWEGLNAEVTSFGLGLELDISDENAKKLHQQMPLTDESKLPPQIQGDSNIKTIRFLLNWAVIISIVLLVVFRILPMIGNIMKRDPASLPCTAQTVNTRTLRYYIEPETSPDAFRTRPISGSQTIYIYERFVNVHANWYGVRLTEGEWSQIFYVRVEDLILDEACPRQDFR